MPINAYTGLMGSGKSYECVSSVILEAVRRGRRVITNVADIDSDAIRAYLHDKHGDELEKLGHVVHVSNDTVSSPEFFCHGTEVDTTVQPGDLVCIDEAWRFWGCDCKIAQEHKIFFREHRHYVSPVTKVCCDLVLMVQDITDLHRILRVVVEMTFRTVKLKSLGLSKAYRVEVYEGYKLNAKTRVNTFPKKYDKAIFPLYSSYTGGTGKEHQIDDRQNLLKDWRLWALVIGTIIVFAVGFYNMWKFFHPEPVTPGAKESAKALPAATQQNQTSGGKAQSQPEGMSRWRLTGYLQKPDGTLLISLHDGKHFRTIKATSFAIDGLTTSGYVDGEMVAFWSGSELETTPFGAALPTATESKQ